MRIRLAGVAAHLFALRLLEVLAMAVLAVAKTPAGMLP